MEWLPEEEWEGEDAYVIGGGPSLRTFDWSALLGKRTIGCNSAFILGPRLCQVCVFGDKDWWSNLGRERTAEFGGRVVGCTSKGHRLDSSCPWLLTMERNEVAELGTDKLQWAGNTGGLAINLALILGARRVFLLGFDMAPAPDATMNWHDLRYEKGNHQVFGGFCRSMIPLARSLPRVFPGREVINVTNQSTLTLFPRVSLKDHFAELLV